MEATPLKIRNDSWQRVSCAANADVHQNDCSIEKLFFQGSNRSGEIFLTTATNRREAEHQNLRMPRLPMMEIDAEASDVLSAHVAPCVHQLKSFSVSLRLKN